MTFRSRLLRSILGVVTATTVASLYFAQSQSTAAYRAVVDEMFKREAASFQRAQQASLSTATDQAAKLANSVRLFAALEEGDEGVYQVAGDELRLGEFSFFRLADAAGKIIPPPARYRHLPGGAEAERSLAAQLPSLRANSSAPASTHVGFVALPHNGSMDIYRLLASSIVNFDKHVGSLILGQQLPGQPAPNLHDASMRSGILVQGRLFSDALSSEDARTVEAALARTPPATHAKLGDGEHRVAVNALNPGSPLPEGSLVSLFSLEDFHARQRTLTWRIVGTGVAALTIATLIGFGLSRQLAEPIRRMVAATRQIRKGDFDIHLAPERTKEINALAVSLNEMAFDLALKERYRSVLQMVADEQVADELIHGNLPLGGELRWVAIIFCDIRGYSALSTEVKPARMIEILNQHMRALTRIVHARRGVVKQFTGDGIMILFGAPKSYGDDAADAARCALEMMHERHGMNETAEHPLRIGIGLASGEVLAGCLGAENRAEYTVVGERVNLAARLSSMAAPDEILIDEATHAQLRHPEFITQPVEPLSLKGYSQPVPAWRLLSATSIRTS